MAFVQNKKSKNFDNSIRSGHKSQLNPECIKLNQILYWELSWTNVLECRFKCSIISAICVGDSKVSVYHLKNIHCFLQVNPGGVADRCGLKKGDAVLRINNAPSDELEHEQAKYEIIRSGLQCSLFVQR